METNRRRGFELSAIGGRGTMKRPIPCGVISDEYHSSDAEIDGEEDQVFDPQKQQHFSQHEPELDSQEMIAKSAEMYQNYM
ncbi:unnamed protein product [Linum trigynum]|uniref:Uncharacterized protein n=1 Tax=Linum trigynum TaxID=586398 RepID=A0AAV2GPN2_9ROSI